MAISETATLQEMMAALKANTFKCSGQESVEWQQKLSLLIQAEAACEQVDGLMTIAYVLLASLMQDDKEKTTLIIKALKRLSVTEADHE